MFARKLGSRNLPQKARQDVPEGDVVFLYSFFFFNYYVIESFLTTLKNSIWYKSDERKKKWRG